MQDKNTIDRHHLLEIILWPNEDGTFREIRNSAERLKELGIYDDYRMTIELTRSEHSRLHAKGLKHSEAYKDKMSATMKGKNNHFYGKNHTKESKAKMSAALKGKPQAATTEFGNLFKEHFGIASFENRNLYSREYKHYKKYGKCSWELQ